MLLNDLNSSFPLNNVYQRSWIVLLKRVIMLPSITSTQKIMLNVLLSLEWLDAILLHLNNSNNHHDNPLFRRSRWFEYLVL